MQLGLKNGLGSGAVRFGPELLDDPNFQNGLDDWIVSGEDGTHILSVVPGGIRYQSDTTTPVLLLRQIEKLIIGKTFQIEVVTTEYTSGQLKTDPSLVVSTGVGTTIQQFVATTETVGVYRNSINVDITISRVSVRQVYV